MRCSSVFHFHFVRLLPAVIANNGAVQDSVGKSDNSVGKSGNMLHLASAHYVGRPLTHGEHGRPPRPRPRGAENFIYPFIICLKK
jgi:hypothetical protein